MGSDLGLGLPDSNGAGLIAKLLNLCLGYTALILNHRGNERREDVGPERWWIDRGFSEFYGPLPGTRSGV